MTNFCRDIVFDLINELKPTPPKIPDFSLLEIRKQIFKTNHGKEGFHFDGFVDSYGQNLFRNLYKILSILNDIELYDPDEYVTEESTHKVSKEMLSQKSGTKIMKKKNQASIMLEDREPESAKYQNKIKKDQKSGNITSNMATLIVDKKYFFKNQIYSEIQPNFHEEDQRFPVDHLISTIFQTKACSETNNLFWDMNMETLENMKEEILAKAEYFSEEELMDISVSIGGRLDILRDAGLRSKPESSVLFDVLRGGLLKLCDSVVDQVDSKREELDLPEIGANQEKNNEEEFQSREKVNSNSRKKENIRTSRKWRKFGTKAKKLSF